MQNKQSVWANKPRQCTSPSALPAQSKAAHNPALTSLHFVSIRYAQGKHLVQIAGSAAQSMHEGSEQVTHCFCAFRFPSLW